MPKRHAHALYCLTVFILLAAATPARANANSEGAELLYWLLLGGAGTAAGAVYVKKRNSDARAERMEEINTQIAKVDAREFVPGQDADLTVFAPAYGLSGTSIAVQAVVHLPPEQQHAYSIASNNDAEAEQLGSSPLAIQLSRNDLIKLTLEATLSFIPEPVQSLHWNGRMVCFVFDVKLPDVTERTPDRFSLRAAVNGVPVGRVLFKIQVGTEVRELRNSPVVQDNRSYKRAFLSYASQDRSQVLRAAQLIKALKMEYFQDLLNLQPGEAWRQRLFSEIERCDVFLLFWSRNARDSKWVIEEAEYALKLSKLDMDRHMDIIPVILEGPPPVAPPRALEEIHFNDSLRHIIFAEETTAKTRQTRQEWMRRLARLADYPLLLILGSLFGLITILLLTR